MKKFKLVLLFFLLLLPINIKAISYENYCGYENNAILKKIASNINVKYDVIEVKDKVSFTVTLSNINKEIMVVDNTTGKSYSYSDTNNGELILSGYSSGQTISYSIYYPNKMCAEEILGVKYVSLPTYNPYYTNSVCDGLIDYSLCQKWVKHGLTKDEFIKKVNEYRKSLIVEEEIEQPIENIKGIFDYLLEFFLNYYMFILPTIIIGGIIGIIYLNRKDSFEFLK